MHLEILNENQKKLLSLISLFKREYYLVGGTAIALYLGHRQSIDFDLFKKGNIRKKVLYDKINSSKFNFQTTRLSSEQINLIIENVKFTFFQFPYDIPLSNDLKDNIKIPELLTLAAMKAFALGRRSKWKDYVDLYFIIKFHYKTSEIAEKAKKLFETMFVERQFYAQLGYFEGINYDEEVVYAIENPPTEEEVKSFLIGVSLKELE